MRAVDAGAAAIVAGWALGGSVPCTRTSLSSRPRTTPAWGVRTHPTALLAEVEALAARFTAVHATHLDDADVTLLGGSGACCCVCPTTERDLADGIGHMRRLSDAGASLALGSDLTL